MRNILTHLTKVPTRVWNIVHLQWLQIHVWITLVQFFKQGVRSITSKKHFMAKQFRSIKPHTKLCCSNELVEKCECALQHSIDSLTDYECIRISSYKWLVRRLQYPDTDKLIPIFSSKLDALSTLWHRSYPIICLSLLFCILGGCWG